MSDKQTKNRADNNIQGEGDRESARHYNEATHEFVKSGKVEKAVEEAAGQDPEEAKISEREGKKACQGV